MAGPIASTRSLSHSTSQVVRMSLSLSNSGTAQYSSAWWACAMSPGPNTHASRNVSPREYAVAFVPYGATAGVVPAITASRCTSPASGTSQNASSVEMTVVRRVRLGPPGAPLRAASAPSATPTRCRWTSSTVSPGTTRRQHRTAAAPGITLTPPASASTIVGATVGRSPALKSPLSRAPNLTFSAWRASTIEAAPTAALWSLCGIDEWPASPTTSKCSRQVPLWACTGASDVGSATMS
mmetsp:Transcript_15282/g.45453  ORF Transcript_15282/g.45453 Transcript_15282/m.45453 type:complete len:239 (+) Transcript_15282:278-994(+)